MAGPSQVSWSPSNSCKLDVLIDYEDKYHTPNCEKKPSNCICQEVSWIWALLPDQAKPVRSGKWMLFVGNQNVNDTWNKVKDLLASKQLGGGAKVSTGGNKHVICVYTNDFEDIKDVFRVLVALRRSRVQNSSIHYKTDEATLEGIYKTDEAAKQAGFDGAKKKEPGRKVSLYSSPPNYALDNSNEAAETIQLLRNNIGPECKTGLVAELRKGVEDEEGKTFFYDPPQIIPAGPSKRKLKKSPQQRKVYNP